MERIGGGFPPLSQSRRIQSRGSVGAGPVAKMELIGMNSLGPWLTASLSAAWLGRQFFGDCQCASTTS